MPKDKGAQSGDEAGQEDLELLEQAFDAAQHHEWEEGSALLEDFLGRHPEHLRAWDLLGFIYFFQQKYRQAEDCCRRALSLEANHVYALKGLGLCLARQGLVDQGIAQLQQAITLQPDWFDPYWDLAVVLVEHHRYPQALEVLRQAAAAVPERQEEIGALAAHIEAAGAARL
jgi:cytochrome c-type biogenesis protein CcmH/NrfG